jgi:hypothetical protein
MNWRRWFTTLLVMLALAACAQGGPGSIRALLPGDYARQAVTVTEEVEAGHVARRGNQTSPVGGQTG